jgi:aromatic ring hydroxylase
VDGSPGSAQIINPVFTAVGIFTGQQTVARLLSQMEFFCGLAMKLADAIGITGFLHVQEKLGEMLLYLETARAVYYGAEAMAEPDFDGVWHPSLQGLRAIHTQNSKTYARLVEIVKTLAGGGFFYAPTEADLNNPEIWPYIDRYVRGRAGISAEERIALFKLAWDATGEAFAQRMEQYARFYSGDPIRLTAGVYVGYDKDPLFEIVERALGRRDGQPIPISPDNPGARTGYRPPPGQLTGAYPAASHPQPARPEAAAGLAP